MDPRPGTPQCRMLTRLTLRSVAGPSLVALTLFAAAGLLLQAAGLLLAAPALPSPASTLGLVLALLPAALEHTLPVAFLVGLTVAYGRWHAEGTWTALRCAGVSGRRLVLPVLIPALLLTALTALTSHLLAPSGRRAAARGLTEAASAVELVPGRFVDIGGVVLHRPLAGGLLVSRGEAVLLAEQGSLSARSDGLLLELEHGRLLDLGDPTLSLSFATAAFPIPVSSTGRRVELAERSDAELAELVGRMRSRARDPSYEQGVLLKRSTMPLLPLLLPLVALPLGLRWGGRPSHTMLVVVGTWTLLRIGDASSSLLGAHLAASMPLLGLTLAAGLLWAGWRDR